MQYRKLISSLLFCSVITSTLVFVSNPLFAEEITDHSSLGLHKKHHKKMPKKKIIKQAQNKISPASQPVENIAVVKTDHEKEDSVFEAALSKHLSSDITLSSNYVYRGISQTLNRPALQGEAIYSFDNGFYATIWGSTVKFKNTGDAVTDDETGAELIPASQDPNSRAYLEIDGILGYKHEFNENLKIDLNAARYFYPGARELNYNQFNSLLTYRIVELGYQYTNNFVNSHTRSAYYLLGLNYDIPANFIKTEGVNLHLTTGYSDQSPISGIPSYHDYSATISKKFKMLTLALQWTTTDGRAKQSDHIDSTQWIASANIALM